MITSHKSECHYCKKETLVSHIRNYNYLQKIKEFNES